MSYALSALPQTAFGQVPTHFGQSLMPSSENGNGSEKVFLVLLLFAAYMNLVLNLFHIPDRRRVLEASR